MNVVIVTAMGSQHKHLCAQLFSTGHIVGILHPDSPAPRKLRSFSRFRKQIRSHGWSIIAQYITGRLFAPLFDSQMGANGKSSLATAFAEGIAQYERIPPHLIHRGCDFRSPLTLNLLAGLKPDLVLCMGGPIYSKQFIDISPITLNFHSGLSPIYNGASSIHFAFANGHPHLCGGTLMRMSTAIDGGTILGHYLPAIESGDSPADLLYKTHVGAAVIYKRLLASQPTVAIVSRGIPQPPPLFYTRSLELGFYQRTMIQRRMHEDISALHRRNESIIEYWRETDRLAASNLYQVTITRLLWGGGNDGTNRLESLS